MVVSMTGFTSTRFSVLNQPYLAEIRTLNHRFLDIHIRLPEGLAGLEMPLRKLVKQHLARGRVDIRIGAELGADASPVRLNTALCRGYIKAIGQLAEECGLDDKIDPVRLLSLPGILDGGRESLEQEDVKSFLEPLSQALADLAACRSQEGQALWKDIRGNLQSIQGITQELEQLVPGQEQAVGERFRERLKRLDDNIDDERLLTEIAILVDKSDINEELVRLQAHIDEFLASASAAGAVGRRLDFITQEMLREVNTIAAKSAVYPISQAAVNIKCELEKIREQIQNIE